MAPAVVADGGTVVFGDVVDVAEQLVDGELPDLDNAISLCSHHHHTIHDTRYHTERLTTGDIRFTRRT